MPRYFLEVRYLGTRYNGFQIQDNAITIQSEIEKALHLRLRKPVSLTGSSRTDAGVHALQNYFHFDVEQELRSDILYNLNAILPADITVRNLIPVKPDAHCRFQALHRSYSYHLHTQKDPLRTDRSWYYPYAINPDTLQAVAQHIMGTHDFTSFSKRNTQVRTFVCTIFQSEWEQTAEGLVYRVRANRFLRGMVRGLVGTMLQTARGRLDINGFKEVIDARDCTRADFTTPAHGLFLESVAYNWDEILL